MKFENTFNDFFILYLKKLWANTKNISSQSKKENLIFITIAIAITMWILYHKYPYITFIFCPLYLYLKTFCSVVRAKALAFRYRKLSKLFDGKIQVIEVDGAWIKLSSFLTFEKVRKQKDELEVFFNRRIEKIEMSGKLFRTIKISFEDERKVEKRMYYLKDHVKTANIKGKTVPFLLGADQQNKIVVGDMKRYKHMLISGEMGGGKSTFLHCMIQSLMWYNTNISFILIDFKRVGLTVYKNFDNCIFIKEYKKFFEYIENLNKEMDKRYDALEKLEIDNLDMYNRETKANIPRIIIVIDEIADIKLSSEIDNDRVEEILRRLINMGRAAGIHVIAATQRPSGVQLSTEIRAGLISKISFAVEGKQTQKMTGVSDTENLRTGEFKVSHIPGIESGSKLKGLYSEKGVSNETFDELKKVKGMGL
jgi:nucleoside-triphosphatase THEP1